VTLGAEALTLNGTGTASQGALSGTGTSSASGTVLLASNSSIGVAAAGDQLTLSGVISGTGASTLTKVGLGTLVLNGAAANTFTGATTINAGTLEAGAAGALGATTDIVVNTGGTLLLSGTGDRVNDSTTTFTLAGGKLDAAGLSETFGALTLTDDSIIDFGSGASTLTFADSTNLWAFGKTLNIWNWSGTPFSGGGTDQLRFASNGLNATQLSQINFFSDAGFNKISITPQYPGNGFVSFGEVVPIPEPSGVVTVLALLGLAGWRERRNTRANRTASRAA
jgi:autotransporter-associated beta strand protein